VEAFSSAKIPGEIFDVLVVDPAFYRTHVDALSRLLRVWQQAHDLARRDPSAVELMAAREGVTAEVFLEMEKGLVYTSLSDQKPMLAAGGLLERNLAAVMAVQRQLGLIRGPVSLPKVSDAPLKRALQ
jgi:ABC-type nitrate/sulfonate/bicarbonate transport system substrate-binding protein